MKKMILLLSLSLAFLGCEESWPAAKTTAAAPSSEIESPIVDEPAAEQEPVVVDPNTFTLELTTSEPTSYKIVINKYVEGFGYDSNPFLTIEGVTSKEKTIESFVADYKFRLTFYKHSSFQESFVVVKKYETVYEMIPLTSDHNILDIQFN